MNALRAALTDVTISVLQVWSLKDVAHPEAVVRDAEAFPGPASSAPIESVKEYVEKRAAGGGEVDGEGKAGAETGGEGERLLWSVAGLALQFKVWYGPSLCEDVCLCACFAEVPL